MNKITVRSQESDWEYSEISLRTRDHIEYELRSRDWDLEYLDWEIRPLSDQEVTLELLRSA